MLFIENINGLNVPEYFYNLAGTPIRLIDRLSGYGKAMVLFRLAIMPVMVFPVSYFPKR